MNQSDQKYDRARGGGPGTGCTVRVSHSLTTIGGTCRTGEHIVPCTSKIYNFNAITKRLLKRRRTKSVFFHICCQIACQTPPSSRLQSNKHL